MPTSHNYLQDVYQVYFKWRCDIRIKTGGRSNNHHQYLFEYFYLNLNKQKNIIYKVINRSFRPHRKPNHFLADIALSWNWSMSTSVRANVYKFLIFSTFVYFNLLLYLRHYSWWDYFKQILRCWQLIIFKNTQKRKI